MSYPPMTVTLARKHGLFVKASNYNWTMFHTDDDYTLVMKALSYANDALVPAAFVESPPWVSEWEARKALSEFVFGLMEVLSYPVQTVKRLTDVTIDADQTAPVWDVFSGETNLPARSLTLVTTTTGSESDITLDKIYESMEYAFGSFWSGVSFRNDPDNQDTVIVDLHDANDLDLKLYNYDAADTTRTLIVGANPANLRSLALLAQGRILHSSGYSKFGPDADLQQALARTTAYGRVFSRLANGSEVKYRFTLDGTTLTEPYAPSSSRFTSDKYGPEDAGSDSVMYSVMLAMTTTSPTFFKPTIKNQVTTAELTWLFYALDKTYAKSKSILSLYQGTKKRLDANKAASKYTRESPSEFGVEYCFARKIDGEVCYRPSFASLTNEAIASYRAMLDERSCENGYVFASNLPPVGKQPIYTDPETGRKVFLENYNEVRSDPALYPRPIGARNIHMIYDYEHAKENGIKGSMRLGLSYYEKIGVRLNGLYVYRVFESDDKLVNYGFYDMNTYAMLDLSDELDTVCDQLEVVLEANERLREQSEIHGNIVDATYVEKKWYEKLWDMLKSHPWILLIVIILLFIVFMKYGVAPRKQESK